jgi:hypothetical protein
MVMATCFAHPNRKCPDTVVTGAGTYCRETGCEVWGPLLEVSDWSQYSGNQHRARLAAAAIVRRRQQSIDGRRAVAMGASSFRVVLHRLYGRDSPDRAAAVDRSRRKLARKQLVPANRTLIAIMRTHRLQPTLMSPGISCTQTLDYIADAISALATKRGSPRATYAALRAFPSLFAATVMDGMVAGTGALPALKIAAAHRIVPDQFKAMGINCRGMSTIAKAIKAAPPLPGWSAQLLSAETRGYGLLVPTATK